MMSSSYTYSRRPSGTERIRVVAPKWAGMNVEIAAGDEVIGTLHRDVEDGEVSYAVQPTILVESLPPAARAATSQAVTSPAPAAPRRRR